MVNLLRCPKCASAYAEGAWICERCEWILDPSMFLPAEPADGAPPLAVGADDGDLDDDDDLAKRTIPVVDAPDLAALVGTGPPAGQDGAELDIDMADILGGDAVILGRLDDGEGESFLSDRTGAFFVAVDVEDAPPPPAPVYLSAELTRRLQPHAVPRRAADAQGRRDYLQPVAGLVFDLVDGRRTVDELRVVSCMGENDLRVVLALLIEKAMIEVTSPTATIETAAVDLDEHTSEIENLPPFAARADLVEELPPRIATPPPTKELFDDLLMVPLPTAAPPEPPPLAASAQHSVEPPAPSPWASSPPRELDPSGFRVPNSDEIALARPAMHVAPLRPRQRNTPMPPTSPKREHAPSSSPAEEPQLAYKPKAGLTVARGVGPPSPTSAAPPSKEVQARAAQFYEMCMKDLHEGRAGRAWGYAKMAADADPSNEKYRQLVADWSKMVGGGPTPGAPAAGGAATIKELFEASQLAEQAGDFETAVAHVRRLCELAPTSAAAFNRLSVLLATRLKDFKAAYAAATTAVELDSKNMTYQSNMMKIIARLEGEGAKGDGAARSGLVGKLFGK